MEEQAVAARVQLADDSARWALALQEHTDRQKEQLSRQLQKAKSEKETAEQDERSAKVEKEAAKHINESIAKGREDIKYFRRRLENERNRHKAAKEENERLSELLKEEIMLRQALEEVAVTERDNLREKL